MVQFYNDVFTKEHYEMAEANRIIRKVVWDYLLYDKLTNQDPTAVSQIFLLMVKLGDLALRHKQVVLQQYNELIKNHIELIKSYNEILQAGAGNISPVANVFNLLQLLLQQISTGALLSTLGEIQGEFRTLATKPLLMYISEILQATEDLADNNLATAYNTALNTYFINPAIVLR